LRSIFGEERRQALFRILGKCPKKGYLGPLFELENAIHIKELSVEAVSVWANDTKKMITLPPCAFGAFPSFQP